MRINDRYSKLFPQQGDLKAINIAGRYSDQWLIIDHEGYVLTSFSEPWSAARYING